MLRRAGFFAIVACCATGLAIACSTFSSSDTTPPADAGTDATPPVPPGSSSGDATVADSGMLVPITCDGGPPDIVPVTTAEATIDSLASDGLHVYFRSATTIARAPVADGGAPEPLLVDAGPPGPIALTANKVFFLSNGQLEVIPQTGGVAPTAVLNGSSVSTLAANADHAFVGLSGGIRSVAEDSTIAGDIRGALRNPTAIAVAKNTLAYIDSEPDGSTTTALYEGTAAFDVVDSPLVEGVAATTLLATDGTTFFWASDSDVLVASTSSPMPATLSHEAQPIGALAADSNAVVFATAAGIKLYDRAHGCFALVTSDPTSSLALSTTDVLFVRNQNEIARARR